mmetsp:Transcript_931/g.3648  ORF Transcript_931/g.3648 Transcript_931/m.3648 type:complete len:261 (-) Transcript_931:985-1767(-)
MVGVAALAWAGSAHAPSTAPVLLEAGRGCSTASSYRGGEPERGSTCGVVARAARAERTDDSSCSRSASSTASGGVLGVHGELGESAPAPCSRSRSTGTRLSSHSLKLVSHCEPDWRLNSSARSRRASASASPAASAPRRGGWRSGDAVSDTPLLREPPLPPAVAPEGVAACATHVAPPRADSSASAIVRMRGRRRRPPPARRSMPPAPSPVRALESPLSSLLPPSRLPRRHAVSSRSGRARGERCCCARAAAAASTSAFP